MKKRDISLFIKEFKCKEKKLPKKIEEYAQDLALEKGYLILDVEEHKLDKRVKVITSALYVGKKTTRNYYFCKNIIDEFEWQKKQAIGTLVDPDEVIKNVREYRKNQENSDRNSSRAK